MDKPPINTELLSIEEAAQLLGVSAATVRRRIKRGDIQATLLEGPHGEQYFILKEEIKNAIEIVDVVPVVNPLNKQEIMQIFTQAVQSATHPLLKEIEALNNQVEQLKQDHIQAVQAAINPVMQELEETKSQLAATKELLERNSIEQTKRDFDIAQQVQDIKEEIHEWATVQREKEEGKSFWKRLFRQ